MNGKPDPVRGAHRGSAGLEPAEVESATAAGKLVGAGAVAAAVGYDVVVADTANGMGGLVAGTTHAPFLAIILIFRQEGLSGAARRGI